MSESLGSRYGTKCLKESLQEFHGLSRGSHVEAHGRRAPQIGGGPVMRVDQ